MMVERRAEAVQKGDAAEPWAGGRCGSVPRDACGSAQQPLDLVKKDLRECGDGRGSVGEHAAQTLRHGDHPLPHGHRWNHVINKMRGGLGHVAAVAGRADAAALLGECHDERLAAARAASPGESEAEEAAVKIAAAFLLDGARHGPLGGFPPGEPALKVLRDHSVERRLLWAAPLVTPDRSLSLSSVASGIRSGEAVGSAKHRRAAIAAARTVPTSQRRRPVWKPEARTAGSAEGFMVMTVKGRSILTTSCFTGDRRAIRPGRAARGE